MYIHLEQDDSVDPRILRTRELLINSFAKLLVENKSIRKVSVQSVTKLAGVNRVTFYAHFTDKYELLDTWARIMFKQAVVEKLPKNAKLDKENLELIAHSTQDFFSLRSRYRRQINEQFESMLEAAIQQELQAVLLSMLERTDSPKRLASNDNIALFLSWAIFGSLIESSRTTKKAPDETSIKEIVTLCEAILS